MITVTIPIGPEPRHIKYLDECIASCYNQTIQPDEILIVNDMNSLDHHELLNVWSGVNPADIPIRMYCTPWHMGVGHAFNIGVAKAAHEYVIMLGADDTLHEDCIAQCYRAAEVVVRPDMTYYWMGVKYSDSREDQYVPCNAAMVTKTLWRATGGFPVEGALGAPDAAYISVFGFGLKYKNLVDFYCVNCNEPLYNYRVRKHSDTIDKAPYGTPIISVRNILTDTLELPNWGRYE